MLNVNILWFAEGLACNYYLRVQLLFYRENMHNLHLVNNIIPSTFTSKTKAAHPARHCCQGWNLAVGFLIAST